MASNSERKNRFPRPLSGPATKDFGPYADGSGRQSAGLAWSRAWLTFRVHLDAFALDPSTYLKALAWRLRGLKVRSRNSIAPLLGRSPRAYALWIRRNETDGAGEGQWPGAAGAHIIPVIDCREGSDGLAATMASLSGAGAQPIILGGPATAATVRIQHPRELARYAGTSGIWLCPLRPGDGLSPRAFATYAAVAATAASALVYADDDLQSPEDRSAPHFKPEWNADLFRHHDYLTGASIVLAAKDTLAALPDTGWAEALVASAVASGGAPVHVPQVLHHRVERPAPKPPAKPASPMPGPLPLVSVILPTRNQLTFLRTCVDGLKRCDYPSVEIIIIDNGSDDPATLDYLSALQGSGLAVLHMPGAFNFSKLNNAAVGRATGDLLCFLNNDVEMVDDDWLSLLVRQAVRSEIGAVGARLLYPDHTIQHAGVFTGIGGGAGHGHRFQREEEDGYFQRARLPQQVSAVTAACLVVARDKFLAVGGFDETDFPVAFNDVDLCLKLNASGWQSFYEPRAMLIHHESKSRGSDSARSNRVRFAGELAALKRKWRTDEKVDPYHHPHLSRFSEQFLIAV